MSSDPAAASYFHGIFAREDLPSITTLPASFICNTDTASGSGEHWVAFYFNAAGCGTYFDPLGLPPMYEDWETYLQKQSLDGHWCYTTKTVQYPTSNACGYHCMFYILCRSRGLRSQEVMDVYTSNLTDNDDFVFYALCDQFY